MDFYQRDRNAVEYSKAVLDRGDTLVLIKYPNNQPAYDATGFPLRNLHRVHSKKLLATESEVFKVLLGSEWLNHRAAKRAGVFPGLPEGIKFVIDLTPPEEGDEALQFTADLSCSAGVLHWHTASSRLNIARSQICGKDETTSLPTSPVKPEDRNRTGVSELSTTVTSIMSGEASGSSYLGGLPDIRPLNGGGSTAGFANVPGRFSANGDALRFHDFKEESLKDEGISAGCDDKVSQPLADEEVLDYCPIRHRAGNERLLQVIEGKDPRLDSAPKVWTLAVLAKHFDCASTVVSTYSPFRVTAHQLSITRSIGSSDGSLGSRTVDSWRSCPR
jgi:hypothetical protein